MNKIESSVRGSPVARILVVDDDPGILNSITDALTTEGYAVTTASNGRDALRAMTQRRPQPDVILLDMRMPDMDGWSVVRLMKLSRIGIPIVLMTAARDARESAEGVGADAYLGKPFGLDQLYAVIGQFCPPATDAQTTTSV